MAQTQATKWARLSHDAVRGLSAMLVKARTAPHRGLLANATAGIVLVQHGNYFHLSDHEARALSAWLTAQGYSEPVTSESEAAPCV